jgi:hypothetical protein
MTFLRKSPKTKSLLRFFCEAFLIIKKYFASTIQDLFHFYKKGVLNPQVVRIRVNRNAGIPECRRKVNPASLVLPLVRCISPASTSVRYRLSQINPAVPSYDFVATIFSTYQNLRNCVYSTHRKLPIFNYTEYCC